MHVYMHECVHVCVQITVYERNYIWRDTPRNYPQFAGELHLGDGAAHAFVCPFLAISRPHDAKPKERHNNQLEDLLTDVEDEHWRQLRTCTI